MLTKSFRRFAFMLSVIMIVYATTLFLLNHQSGSKKQRNQSRRAQRETALYEVKDNVYEKKGRNPSNDYVDFRPPAINPSNLQKYYVAPNRIFHLDLKGAAPKMEYMLKLVPFIKRIGATGIMIEYEDMFPFTGNLSDVKAGNAYTIEELRHLLQTIQANSLDIIPLVQSVGHLEYILKYPDFAKYRQEERYPQVICLADEGAVRLVKEALKQVLALHKDFPMKYFHIGADEVFQVGRCEKDRNYMIANNVDTEFLLLKHIAEMAKFVKAQVPGNRVNVLIWHDMLVNLQTQSILRHGLSGLVEPVVWNYMENLDDQLLPDFWHRADGPDQYASNVPHYLNNHISWLKQMNEHHSKFKQFRGIIVTGWQRFDHFAIICEIIPVGLLSAAVNMAVLKNGQYSSAVMRSVSKLLKCSSMLYIDNNPSTFIPQCSFPGVQIFYAVQALRSTIISAEEQVFNDQQVRGWIAKFNEKHLYTQPWYLDQTIYKIKSFLREMEICEQNIKTEMQSVFYNDTIAEFVFVYVKPTVKRLKELLQRIDKLSVLRVFPRRPFAVHEF